MFPSCPGQMRWFLLDTPLTWQAAILIVYIPKGHYFYLRDIGLQQQSGFWHAIFLGNGPCRNHLQPLWPWIIHFTDEWSNWLKHHLGLY